MHLMLAARWRALKHIRFFFPRRGCRIWRLYKWWGLKTCMVFCECGKFCEEHPSARFVCR